MKKPLLVCVGLGVAAILAAQTLAQSGDDRVVAKVGDEKITFGELKAELPAGNTDPRVEKAALQALVNRKVLVQEAERQQIDKTPIGSMVIKRAEETALTGVLEKQLAGTPPTVSDQDVRAFVAANPLMFAVRHLLTLNQYITQEGGEALAKKLQPANTMDDFQQILQQNAVTYQRTAAVIDTLKLNPKVAAQLVKMKTGDVFIAPRGPGLELSGVVSNSPAPIAEAQAEQVARVLLVRRAMAQKVGSEVSKIVKAGQADVKLNDDYAPKKK